MNICSHNHDEIVYDSKHCPLCDALNTIEDLSNGLSDLKKDLENMEIS